jgi:hypothetical protein
VRTTDELGRWGGASTDGAAENLSTLDRARKLFAGLSRSLDGEIDRIQSAVESEPDEEQIRKLNGTIRENWRTLNTILELEAKLMRKADKQSTDEGVIDLAQAREEIARRLSRLVG